MYEIGHDHNKSGNKYRRLRELYLASRLSSHVRRSKPPEGGAPSLIRGLEMEDIAITKGAMLHCVDGGTGEVPEE